MAIGQCQATTPIARVKKKSGVAKNLPSPIVEKRTEIILVAEPGPWGVLYVV